MVGKGGAAGLGLPIALVGDAGFTQAPQVPGAGVVGIGAAGGLRKPLPTACGGQGQGLDIAVGVQVAVLPCQGRDQLAVEFPGLFPTAGHIGELNPVPQGALSTPRPS